MSDPGPSCSRCESAASLRLHAPARMLILVNTSRATRAIETGRRQTVEPQGLEVVLDDSAEELELDEEYPQNVEDERGVSADLVRAYLNGIGRTKLLTAEQ